MAGFDNRFSYFYAKESVKGRQRANAIDKKENANNNEANFF